MFLMSLPFLLLFMGIDLCKFHRAGLNVDREVSQSPGFVILLHILGESIRIFSTQNKMVFYNQKGYTHPLLVYADK